MSWLRRRPSSARSQAPWREQFPQLAPIVQSELDRGNVALGGWRAVPPPTSVRSTPESAILSNWVAPLPVKVTWTS